MSSKYHANIERKPFILYTKGEKKLHLSYIARKTDLPSHSNLHYEHKK